MNGPEENPDNNDDATILELRIKTLALLKHLREDFIDELPPFPLRTDTPNYKRHKCRLIFFGTVKIALDTLITSGAITDPRLIEDGKKFIEYATKGDPIEKTNPLGPEFFTKVDIDYVNSTLDKFVAALFQ